MPGVLDTLSSLSRPIYTPSFVTDIQIRKRLPIRPKVDGDSLAFFIGTLNNDFPPGNVYVISIYHEPGPAAENTH